MMVMAVARYTARVLWHRKLWGCAAGFAALMLMAALWWVQLGPGLERRLLIDVEMTGVEMAMLASAVLAFAVLVFEEQEWRTVWLVLSKPIRRSEYLVGKLVGVGMVLMANFGLMVGWMLLLNVVMSAPLEAVHGWALAAGFGKAVVTVAALGVVSLWASSAVSFLLLGGLVVIISHLVHHVRVVLEGPLHPVSRVLLWMLYYAFPNFHYFHVREAAWGSWEAAWSTWGVMGGYALAYVAGAVTLACWLYSKKEFL